MSKPVFVVWEEIAADRFHFGRTEFQGIYKTLKLAQDATQDGWCYGEQRLKWTEDIDGPNYGNSSRWTANYRKGTILVIEDYEVITE
jgi:hypothetical protein